MAVNYTPEQLLKLGEISAEFQAVVEEMPGLTEIIKTYDKDAVYGIREKMLMDRASQPPRAPPANVTTIDRKIPMRDGFEIPIRIYSPTHPDGRGSPLIVNFHGGGFMLGDLGMGSDFSEMVVSSFNAVFVDVDYRLAPEYPFPTPVNDAYDAMKWAAHNTAYLHADTELGFLVSGVSAGGNLSAVISLLARDNNLKPPLTGAFLSAPSVFHNKSVPEKYKSRFLALEQNESAPILNRPMYDYIEEMYQPDHQSHLFAAILHPNGFKGLPRTYIAACGLDPLRDDAILYEEALREDGVETKLSVYPGVPHCWWGFLPQLEASKKYELDRVAAIKWLLRKE